MSEILAIIDTGLVGLLILRLTTTFLGQFGWFFKSEIKKDPLYLLYFRGLCDLNPPPPQNKRVFCFVLAKRSSLEKSSSSGRQGCHDSSSVCNQFFYIDHLSLCRRPVLEIITLIDDFAFCLNGVSGKGNVLSGRPD